MELEDEAYVLVSEFRQFLSFEGADVDAVDAYSTLVSLVEGAHDLQEGSLASTAWSHDAHHLPFVNMQVYAFEHLQRSETFLYSFDVYHIYFLCSNLLLIHLVNVA